MDGLGKFVARNGCGATFHDDNAARDVGEVSRFERRRTRGQSESVSGEDGVARAGNVNGLVAAVNCNENWRLGRLKENHAVATTGDEERRQLHLLASGFPTAAKFGQIFANGSVMQGFQFCFVGSGGSNASTAVIGEAITRVQGDGKVFAGV